MRLSSPLVSTLACLLITAMAPTGPALADATPAPHLVAQADAATVNGTGGAVVPGGPPARVEQATRAPVPAPAPNPAVAETVMARADEQALRAKIGQMLMFGFSGDSPASAAGAERLVASGAIGGVIYFKYNIASLDAAAAINRALRQKAPAGLPPFIAIDQEGGQVQRLTAKMGFPQLPSAEKVVAAMTPPEAEEAYSRMAEGLAEYGFNLNFGPVVDVNVNPDNPVIGKLGRSYGADPDVVTDYAEAFIAAHHKAGVLTAPKHFPGHGSSTKDTHKGFVDITGTWNRDVELLPYRKLIGTPGMIDMVMVGHLTNANSRQDQTADFPATLSKGWIDGELRQGLGYQGVVVTDDMNMGAITKEFGTDTAVVKAVAAGADILLFSAPGKDPPAFARHIADVLIAAAKADPDLATQIERSYGRITALKQKIGPMPGM